jgi:hypothetical protein
MRLEKTMIKKNIYRVFLYFNVEGFICSDPNSRTPEKSFLHAIKKLFSNIDSSEVIIELKISQSALFIRTEIPGRKGNNVRSIVREVW